MARLCAEEHWRSGCGLLRCLHFEREAADGEVLGFLGLAAVEVDELAWGSVWRWIVHLVVLLTLQAAMSAGELACRCRLCSLQRGALQSKLWSLHWLERSEHLCLSRTWQWPPGVRQRSLRHGAGLLENPTNGPGVLFVAQKEKKLSENWTKYLNPALLNCTIWIHSAYIEWDGLVNGSLGERGIVERREPEFMHHPVSFHPSCRSPLVEHKRLLQAYALGTLRGVDRPVCPCGLPEPSCCDSVWSHAIAVFPVPWTVEVPLFLTSARKLCWRTKTMKSEMQNLQHIRNIFR